ncbi:MAG: glycosyltransferase family 9 protein [Bryobacteraceae bacterium]
MASTSNQAARELLERCLRGEPWTRGQVRALAREEALLTVVAEGLADRFEPALCEAYAEIMAEALGCAAPLVPAEVLARYRRVRGARFRGPDPERVFVLSRVTLGADVAVTSVMLDGLKRRFPRAEIVFAGPRKNWELFERDARLRHLPLSYPRGTLRERLAPWLAMRPAFETGIVVDTDSRLTQLGLLPVCPEERYFLFESRAYGAETGDALPELAARWLRETFGAEGAEPYVALAEPAWTERVAVSLGVGENPAKRIADPFEEELLRDTGACAIDLGAGGEEAERVKRAVERSGVAARVWDGSFAGFAAIISRSGLYVGYDSAGQHVAAACGVPLVCIFAGYPAPRMFQRWRPTGKGPIHIVRVEDPAPEAVLAEVKPILRAVLSERRYPAR